MVQNAIIKKIIDPNTAQVSLLRQLECGLHCGGQCEGCGQKPTDEILALASNPIGAKVGELVEVAPVSGHGILTAVMVFLLPCIGLGAGYVIGQSLLGLGEGAALGTAGVGLLAGFIPAILANRAILRSSAPQFSILKRL